MTLSQWLARQSYMWTYEPATAIAWTIGAGLFVLALTIGARACLREK